MYENWAVSFNCEKQSLPTVEYWRTCPQSKGITHCGLDAAVFSNVFRVVEKLWAVLNPRRNQWTQHKLFKPNYRENEIKTYQETDFLSSEGLLLTSPGCRLTYASLLDVEQVRFASWSVYRVLWGNDLFNLSAVSVLSQKYNACTFRLQK